MFWDEEVVFKGLMVESDGISNMMTIRDDVKDGREETKKKNQANLTLIPT